MALTKLQKNEIIADVTGLLESSKLTVVARYQGTTVKALQQLRRDAKSNGTTVKVIKNRLVIQALNDSDILKTTDTSSLQGMLLYAFNSDDEVAPAQNLHSFAKQNPTLEFVGGITPNGEFMSAEDVKSLANLPSKEQLRAMLVGTIAAPLSGFTQVLSGNIRGVINVLNSRAEALN